MMRRLLGVLVVMGLALVLVLLNVSATGGGAGEEQQIITVTIRETCSGSMNWPRHTENIKATVEETNVYRVLLYDGGGLNDNSTEIELVSFSRSFNLSGEGMSNYSSVKRWTFAADPASRDHPFYVLHLSLAHGWAKVGTSGTPCEDAEASGGYKYNIDYYLPNYLHDNAEDPEFEKQLKSTFPKNSKDISVSGHASLKASDESDTATREIDYSIVGGYHLLPEVVLIPQEDYDLWLPMAGANESKPGNTFEATVMLHKPGKPTERAGKEATFRFTLSDVSKEPGTCLNWPDKTSETEETKKKPIPPDLKIDQDKNPTLDVAGDGMSATTRKPGDSATVVITVYDWGAFGRLSAKATVEGDNIEIPAHIQGSNKSVLTIPHDDNDNHIADLWEKFHDNVSDPKADEDERPTGDSDKGDGLSAYEEYRGLRVRGEHIRTNPSIKDLFIFDSDNLGIGYFSKSGLNVHLIDFTEYGIEMGATNPNVINGNRGFAALGPQHILYLMDTDADGNYGFSEGDGPGTPKTVKHIKVDRALCKVAGQRNIDSTIAHELAHGCNVWHHGKGDYRISRVRLRKSDGSPGSWFAVGDKKVSVAGGQESGEEQCIMRYNESHYYENPQGTFEWEKKDKSIQRGFSYLPFEKAGTFFCSGTKGTGVNDSNRAGGSKAGDASRGKCSKQLCVNDAKH